MIVWVPPWEMDSEMLSVLWSLFLGRKLILRILNWKKCDLGHFNVLLRFTNYVMASLLVHPASCRKVLVCCQIFNHRSFSLLVWSSELVDPARVFSLFFPHASWNWPSDSEVLWRSTSCQTSELMRRKCPLLPPLIQPPFLVRNQHSLFREVLAIIFRVKFSRQSKRMKWWSTVFILYR